MTRSKWPIWVTIVFIFLLVDVAFRVTELVYGRLDPSAGSVIETISGWTISNLVLAVLATVAGVAVFRRRPIGLTLVVLVMVAWIVELAVSTLIDEYETSLEQAILVGLVISLASVYGFLIERLLRSAAVHEFFGIVDPDRNVHLDEPPPPPTFAE